MSITLSDDKYDAILSYARSNMLNLIATGSPASSVFRGQERTGINITRNPAHFCLFVTGIDEEFLYSIGKDKKDNVFIFNKIFMELNTLQSNSNYDFEPFYHNVTKQPIILINLPDNDTKEDRKNMLYDIHEIVEGAYKFQLGDSFKRSHLISAVTADFYDFGISVRRDFDLAVKYINNYHFFLKQYKVIDETIRLFSFENIDESYIVMHVSILKEAVKNVKLEILENTLHHLFSNIIKPTMSIQSCQFAMKLLNDVIKQHQSICNYGLNELKFENYSFIEELEKEYIMIFKSICQELVHKNNSIDKEIDETMRYIDEHYKQQLNLIVIAKYVGFNKNYLCTKFKKETGITIHQYLVQVRMNHARKLLMDNNESIDSVAYCAGFENGIYFKSIFKKYNGLTPSAYREYSRTSILL